MFHLRYFAVHVEVSGQFYLYSARLQVNLSKDTFQVEQVQPMLYNLQMPNYCQQFPHQKTLEDFGEEKLPFNG